MKQLIILPIDEQEFNAIVSTAKQYFIYHIDNMKQKSETTADWSYIVNEPDASADPVYICNLANDGLDQYDLQIIESHVNKTIKNLMSEFQDARNEYLEQCREEAEALCDMEVW